MLQQFIIGSSGLVYFSHMYLLSKVDESYYDYSPTLYSFLAPIYYGIMTIIAFYIGNVFKLSLENKILITSILSITFIVSLNYFISQKYYKPYKNYNNQQWINYIIKNGLRHLFAFNVVIYLITKYFHYHSIELFTVGSTLLTYFITNLIVIGLIEKRELNIDYLTFATYGPLVQGFEILLSLFLLNTFLKINLFQSLLIWSIFSSIFWTSIIDYYDLNDQNIFSTLLIDRLIKAFLIYFLLR